MRCYCGPLLIEITVQKGEINGLFVTVIYRLEQKIYNLQERPFLCRICIKKLCLLEQTS